MTAQMRPPHLGAEEEEISRCARNDGANAATALGALRKRRFLAALEMTTQMQPPHLGAEEEGDFSLRSK
jgi:hypothetical protein